MFTEYAKMPLRLYHEMLQEFVVPSELPHWSDIMLGVHMEEEAGGTLG